MSFLNLKLPIHDHAEAIVSAIRSHRVVVVEGPPGCGKTTQLPRMLRHAGLIPRLMGVTQPRRIAATSVAARLAAEEKTELGDKVGYAIRFDDRTSRETNIKVMTDGILLQEARGDPSLSAYDLIMVDEAHERSLNIDLTLGLLHRVLSRRNDLRVVVSSATLNPEIFCQFFASAVGEVPILSVPTRTHPVTVRYTPPEDGSPDALIEMACEQVADLSVRAPAGHMLVFLPGEALINKVAAQLSTRGLHNCHILPLFGRMPQDEQQRVFDDVGAARKIILSTNIAETSITIDGVVAVIDAGLAKVPWFNGRTGVTTLREEPISRASADQRAGRAGRTGPGEIIRLYDEASFLDRPEFGEEEILRIDLSEAVLRLIDLGIRDVENFPLPTQPYRGKLIGALRQLMALGAIDNERRLTATGRRMVPFPLSPPMARMVVEASERFESALNDVLLAGAFLSVRSPFAYPKGFEDEARIAQRHLRHPLGDSMTCIQAYARWHAAQDRDDFCKKYFLEPDIMAFVERAHTQLVDIAESLGLQVIAQRAKPAEVIRCLAAGYADKVLIREAHGYAFEALTGLRVALHPSSALFSSRCQFAVATELMNSGRLYAFGVSALEPSWVAEVSPDAAKRWGLKRSKAAETYEPGHAPPKYSPGRRPGYDNLGQEGGFRSRRKAGQKQLTRSKAKATTTKLAGKNTAAKTVFTDTSNPAGSKKSRSRAAKKQAQAEAPRKYKEPGAEDTFGLKTEPTNESSGGPRRKKRSGRQPRQRR